MGADEKQEKKDYGQVLMETVKEFCFHTTAHGFERIASTQSVKGKFLWSTCVFALIAYMVVQLVSVALDFSLYPVEVKLDLQYNNTQVYPAVVVCNMNAVKSSALAKYGKSNITTEAWNQAQSNGYRSVTSFMNSWLASLNESTKKALGHEGNTFILDCTWKGMSCSIENFTFFYNFMYGNCYVFGDQEMLQTTSTPGKQNGLSLILNIEADEYTCDFTESYGAVIDISSPFEMHFPEERGFLIAPGQSTSIGIRTRLVQRLGLPYEGTACGIENGNPLIYEDRRYSETACRKSCIAKLQKSFCGCTDVTYPLEPHCNPLNKTQKLCVANVSEQTAISDLGCNCTADCRTMLYPASISSTVWPTAGYLPRLQNILGKKAASVTRNLTEVRKNLARVDIYFKTMTVEVITQVPKYTVKDLLSSMGGSLGLFAGMSILSIVEFFQLALNMMKSMRKERIQLSSPLKQFESTTARK